MWPKRSPASRNAGVRRLILRRPDRRGCLSQESVFAGNAGDPATFPEAVDAVRAAFGLEKMIMVGDRDMITSARIKALRELEGMAWITCLRGPPSRS